MTPKRPGIKPANEVKVLKDKAQPKKWAKEWADMTPQERVAVMKQIKPQGVRE